MSRVLGLVISLAMTGIILYGLTAQFTISYEQYQNSLVIYAYAGIITIALILITRRIYLPIQTLESFAPKPKRDGIVVFLVALQLVHICMEIYAEWKYSVSSEKKGPQFHRNRMCPPG